MPCEKPCPINTLLAKMNSTVHAFYARNWMGNSPLPLHTSVFRRRVHRTDTHGNRSGNRILFFGAAAAAAAAAAVRVQRNVPGSIPWHRFSLACRGVWSVCCTCGQTPGWVLFVLPCSLLSALVCFVLFFSPPALFFLMGVDVEIDVNTRRRRQKNVQNLARATRYHAPQQR